MGGDSPTLWPTVARPMTTTFRLMTANLLNERCDVDHFSRVLDRVAPDIIVTQELAPSCAEVVAGVFPNHRLRPSLGFLGRGAATRFDAEFGEFEVPGRPGISMVTQVDGSTVNVGSVHLLNPLQPPWWVTARERGRQLDALFAWLDHNESGPVVVAGDFNASPRWPAYRRMVGRLRDLVAERADRAGEKTQPTWAWRPGWPRLLRIDHVFGTGVRATGVTVEPLRGTDHAAVVADIEIVDRQ
jgi:endonuclease/exonuclease/phosphatase family metal-dependent hydrolase